MKLLETNTFLALTAILLSAIISSVNGSGKPTVVVDVNGFRVYEFSENAVAVNGSLRSHDRFKLIFSIPKNGQGFDFQIQEINIHISQPLTLVLERHGPLLGSGIRDTQLNMTTTGTQNFSKYYFSDPLIDTHSVELSFSESVANGKDDLCDVLIVITSRFASCSGNFFRCHDNLECISSELEKDGYRNCLDGSDESQSAAKATTKSSSSISNNSYNYYNSGGVSSALCVSISIVLILVFAVLIYFVISSDKCKDKSPQSLQNNQVACSSTSNPLPVRYDTTAVHLPPSYDYEKGCLPPTYNEALQLQESTLKVVQVQSDGEK